MERLVPSRLVSFAGRIVRLVDSDDPDVFVDADEAVQTKYASGGRTGEDEFLITYYASGRETWCLALDERALRRLAAGALSTFDVDVHVSEKKSPEPRARRGDAFALWGETDSDRAMVASEADIDALLAWLRHRTRQHDGGVATAVFGSAFGDLAFLAVASDDTAYLGVVRHSGARRALEGDLAQVEPLPAAFPLLPDPVPLEAGNYVPLATVRDALTRLLLTGSFDRKLRWTSSMDGELLGDLRCALTERGFTVPLSTPFRALAECELHVEIAHAEEAKRRKLASVADDLVGALVDRKAIELTGDQGRKALCERIAKALERRAEREPLGLMDLLMTDRDVVEVFVDDAELDTLLAGMPM